MERGSFEILEKFVLGPPSEADLQPLLTNPTTPIANDVWPKAYNNCIKSFTSHLELDTWPFDAWDGFWG